MINKNKQGREAFRRGYLYEGIAEAYLKKQGYKILFKNLLGVRGEKVSELDLVAIKDETIIFIEVKYRKYQRDVYYALTPKMIERIKNAALLFISKNEAYQDYEIRFDVLLFSKDKSFEHIKAAF